VKLVLGVGCSSGGQDGDDGNRLGIASVSSAVTWASAVE